MTIRVVNLEEFTRRLREESRELTQDQLVLLQRRIVLDAWARVIQKTPVDLGYLRAGWQVTIGAPGNRLPGPEPGPGSAAPPAPTLANAIAALAQLRPFQTVFISNPVPYASIIETGGFVPANPGPSKDRRPGREGRVLVQNGFSTQAPQGMVAVTVAELLAIFR